MNFDFETKQSLIPGLNSEIDEMTLCFRQKALFNPTHKIYTDLEVEEIQMCIFRGLTSRTIDAIVENNGAMPEE